MDMEAERVNRLREQEHREREEQERRRREVEERKEMMLLMKQVADENAMLKEKIWQMEAKAKDEEQKFSTPEEDGRPPKEAVRPPGSGLELRLEDGNRRKEAGRPPKSELEARQEAERPPKEDERDARRERHGVPSMLRMPTEWFGMQWGSTGPRRSLTGDFQRTFQEAERDPGGRPRVTEEAADPHRRGSMKPPEEAVDHQRRGEWKPPEEAADPRRREGWKAYEEAQDHRHRGASRETSSKPSGEFSEKSLEFMCLMMESMKELAKKFDGPRDEETNQYGIEVVRGSQTDLPTLGTWTAMTGPLMLGDWFLLVEPIVADMSSTAEVWWRTLMKEAEAWYQIHVSLNPLEKVRHSIEPPSSLRVKKWERLERRVAASMLKAIPESIREELVAARRMGAFGIVTQLLLSYCPGGVAEKQMLLRNLEDPPEINVLSEAPGALRKWLRWKQRSIEVGAVTPDPALLLKGLNKLTGKVISANRDLQFRVSLMRSGLSVDTCPSQSSVEMLATHLLAELDQAALTEKKVAPLPPKTDPKVKALEVENPKGKGKGKDGKTEEEEKTRGKCRFFLTEGGCRKGKSCSWIHERDEQKRCWTCGALDHMSPSCTRPKTWSSKEGSPSKAKAWKMDEGGKASSVKADGDGTKGDDGSTSPMKDLIEEATRMLRSLDSQPSSPSASSSSAREEEERSVVMQKLQEQLNSMKVEKQPSQKVFKVMKLSSQSELGLLDSGATHPLRPVRNGEATQCFRTVDVSMADGQVIQMKMTPGGCMVSSVSGIEPIVPMGWLTGKLGCEVTWKEGKIEVRHPRKGLLPVEEREGCPQIPRRLALDLIQEMEEVSNGLTEDPSSFDWEIKWMKDLIETHPVLKTLPDWIRERLCVCPGSWQEIPGNKRKRKSMRKEGFVVHLFSGPEEGFHLGRAWKEMGGDERRLVEVDLCRGSQHDMMKDRGVYSGLLRAALEGKILAVVGGPNCRSRSILRHYPVEGRPDAPRPIRCWNGGEYGMDGITDEEKSIIYEDDVMLWRMWFIFIVAHQVNQAMSNQGEVKVSMEHPSSPKKYNPDVVSWWDTSEWMLLKEVYQFDEVSFSQGSLGGEAVKPTTLGGSLKVYPEEFQTMKSLRRRGVLNSKQLSRWAPGMMRMMASSLVKHVYGDNAPKLRVLSWEEHLAFNHTPYRRDCRVCQESLQQVEPHRKVVHPQSAVLSVDVAGPLTPAVDQGGNQARWMLVGVLTWRFPKSDEKMKTPEDDPLPPEAPKIEKERDEEEVEEEEEEDPEERAKKKAEDYEGEEGEEAIPEENPEGEVEGKKGYPGDVADEMELRAFRMGLPMLTKTCKEVTQTVMEFIIRLRMDGYHVNQLHSDHGNEFGLEFRRWAKARGIHVTRTPGDDPRGNGRAEQAVKCLKNQIRKALLQAHQTAKWWPWALRYVNEVNRCFRMGTKPHWPAFLEEVRVRKRTFRQEVFAPGCEKVQYLYPAEEEHGHWVVKEGEQPRVTRMILRKTAVPLEEDVWIAVAEEAADALKTRREVRKRPAIRRIGESKEDEEEARREEERKRRMRFEELMTEESVLMMEDGDEVADIERGLLKKIRKMMETDREEEELLQTKIVSPKEVMKEWDKWVDAIDSEVQALLKEKKAFEEVDEEEEMRLIRDAKKRGRKVQFIPSSLVFTKKPGPHGGRRKARWVVCGNYEEKSDSENNFSSGADAAAFRVMVWMMSRMQWTSKVLDIKTAFLNADLVLGPDEDMILVMQPQILKEKRYFSRKTCFKPVKAVYGFRRSPKLWGGHRDQEMTKFEIKTWIEGEEVILWLSRMLSEENMWKVIRSRPGDEKSLEDEMVGLVMTYVDDVTVTGSETVVDAVVKKFQETWSSSTPQKVDGEAVRFLGMDLMRVQGEDGRDEWLITQESYTKDLLERFPEINPRRIPISRDQATMSESSEKPSPDEVREAQRMVGEALWLVTRTRPDAMFSCSRMGSMVTKNPQMVKEVYTQLLGYLKSTCGDGLRYRDGGEGEVTIQMYSDASFAPDGGCSHGCFMVFVNNNLLFWRSGRQQMVTLSTAESELMEIIEGMTAAESVACIVSELCEEIQKVAVTDSQSARSILTVESGHWRTRHLRLRAAFARQAISEGDWSIQYTPGEFQVADLGTKALTSVRIDFLKKLIGMEVKKEEEGGREDEKTSEVKEVILKRLEKMHMSKKEKTAKALRIILLMASLKEAYGLEAEGGTSQEDLLTPLVIVYTVIVVLATTIGVLLFQKVWKEGVSRRTMIDGESLNGTDRRPPKLEELEEERLVDEGLQKEEEGTSEAKKAEAEDPMKRKEDPEAKKLWKKIRWDFQRSLRFKEEESTRSAELPFQVKMTRYGSVYHQSPECPYLKAPLTGPTRESKWCPMCRFVTMKTVGLPQKNVPLWISGWGSDAHNHKECPKAEECRKVTPCVRCCG
eukprot:Skav225959  [mRNA]  locus=scaffold6030:76316:83572:- [translate_table: standard]